MDRFEPINIHDAETLKIWRSLKTTYPEKMIPPHHILLNALEAGLTLRIDDLNLCMAMDDVEDTNRYAIGYIMERSIGDGPIEKVFMLADNITIAYLISVASSMTTEEIVAIALSTTMIKNAKENIEKREKKIASHKLWKK
jgi:hypothetical protein